MDAKGHLSVGGEIRLSRAVMRGADKKIYPCSAWAMAPAALSFACDDSQLPQKAFPYVIDPDTTTLGPYQVDCNGYNGTVTWYNSQIDGEVCGVGDMTAPITVDLPSGSTVTGVEWSINQDSSGECTDMSENHDAVPTDPSRRISATPTRS